MYYLGSIAAYLHDIGKIITNYLHDIKGFKEYIGRAKGVRSHKHAFVGSLFLADKGFPDLITDLVRKHHEEINDKVISIIKWADGFDASYRAGTAKDKGKKLPIRVASLAGLSVEKTVHNISLKDYLNYMVVIIKDALENGNYRLASHLVDGLFHEVAIHLRSDSEKDENISLYAHSKFVAALTSLKLRCPNEEPFLIIIKPKIEERAKFMTTDIVEYLVGLSLYTYFGVLGALSKTLISIGLEPSFHIISESPSRYITVIGKSHVTTLIKNLKLLTSDISAPILVKAYCMKRRTLQLSVNTELQPEYISTPLRSVSYVCDICHTPIHDQRLMLRLRRVSKTITLCEHCSIITNAYNVLTSNNVYSIKESKYGLLEYPHTGLVLELCNPYWKQSDYLIMRTLRPSRNDICKIAIPSIDVHTYVFKKNYKYFIGISLTRFINKLLIENKIHEYLSTITILGHYVYKVFMKTAKNMYLLDAVDDEMILEAKYPVDAKELIKEILDSGFREYAVIALVQRGNPGTTYKRIKSIIDKLIESDNILAIETYRNAISLKDVEPFNKLSQLLKVPPSALLKVILKLYDKFTEYINSLEKKDYINAIYLKSVILLRLLGLKEDLREEGTVTELLPLGLLFLTQKEEVHKNGNAHEKLSEFLGNSDNVRKLIKITNIVNKFGEVIG